jgi:hypothetical protein
VVALDRDVIARGLSVRYAATGLSPVDPDEYIEKTISLSFDLPQLSSEQVREYLRQCAAGVNLTDDQIAAAAVVLGSNPRRIKRFGRLLNLYAQLRAGGQTPAEISDLSLKLILISYCNSTVFSLMRRDPELALRLQQAINVREGAVRANILPQQVRDAFALALQREPPQIAAALNDERLWRAFQQRPAIERAQLADLGAALHEAN